MGCFEQSHTREGLDRSEFHIVVIQNTRCHSMSCYVLLALKVMDLACRRVCWLKRKATTNPDWMLSQNMTKEIASVRQRRLFGRLEMLKIHPLKRFSRF